MEVVSLIPTCYIHVTCTQYIVYMSHHNSYVHVHVILQFLCTCYITVLMYMYMLYYSSYVHVTCIL